jgi:hypothetical protein
MWSLSTDDMRMKDDLLIMALLDDDLWKVFACASSHFLTATAPSQPRDLSMVDGELPLISPTDLLYLLPLNFLPLSLPPFWILSPYAFRVAFLLLLLGVISSSCFLTKHSHNTFPLFRLSLIDYSKPSNRGDYK